MKYFYFCLFIFFFSTPILSQVNLKNGLVACYPFNSNANDESGNNNNGTVNGAILTIDRFGKANSAYNFIGSSLISVSPDQFKNQSYTYATWVKLNNSPSAGNNNAFITVGGTGGDQVLSVTSSYQLQTSNGFNVGGYNNANPIQSNNWTRVTPSLNKWYHVVCTRDNNSIKLYIDGQLIANNSTLTATGGTTPNYGSPTYVTFGARNGGASQYMEGSLDDIHLYSRPLNAIEVKALYDGNTPQSISIISNTPTPCGGEKIAFTTSGATNTSKYQWKVDGLNQGTNSKSFDYTSTKKAGDYTVKISVEVTDQDICFPQKPTTTEQIITIKDCTPPSIGVNLKNGLVACYPFNSNSKDESGNNNDGNVKGASLTLDRFGKANSAYNFNGISDYIEISPDKLKTNTFSYALWVKPSSIPPNGIAYFLFSIGSDNGDQAIGLNKGYTNGTDGFTGGGYLNVGENSFCQKGSSPNVNQWYHVVVIRELNSYKVYIDGILICTSPLLTKPPFYGTSMVKASIGSRYNSGQFAHCVLDDIHLYNRPLNANEVKALYEGNAAQTITISTNNPNPCGGEKITLTANGATSTSKYQWKVDGINQGTNSNSFTYNSLNKSADYQVKLTVEVTDEDLCFSQKPVMADKTINIKFCSIITPNVGNKILIPNAFSPNSDGMNDTWEIFSIAGNPDVIVEIYNRWGELIYYSKGYLEPWNGTYRDKPVLEGTYPYIVRVDSETVLRGTILVVR